MRVKIGKDMGLKPTIEFLKTALEAGLFPRRGSHERSMAEPTTFFDTIYNPKNYLDKRKRNRFRERNEN